MALKNKWKMEKRKNVVTSAHQCVYWGSEMGKVGEGTA